MFKEKIIKALVHPLFIGLVLTSVILVFISPDVSKYQVEIVEKLLTPGLTKIHFSDLDNDKNSEEISIDNAPTILKIMILKGKRLMAQYNLRSRPLAAEYLYTADHNNDGFKEIYLLTLRGDSVLLSIIDPIIQENFILKERLIFYNDTIQYEVDIPQGEYVGLVDFRDGHGKSLVFSICTGYSKQPRSIFRYDILSDDLHASPMSGASKFNPFLYDLNSDSVPEILFRTAATGNYHTPVPYSDQSAWLMALDKDLEYVFDPVEFKGYPSSLTVSSFKSGSSTQIAVFHDYYGSDTINPGLYIYDNQGIILQSISVELNDRGNYYISAKEGNTGPKIYLLDANKRIINVLNETLKVTGEISIPPLYRGDPMAKMDIDLNGVPEYIFFGDKKGSFVIFQHDLTHPLVVDIEESDYPEYITTLVRNGRGLFYSQFEDAGYITSYEKNPLYYLRFPLIVLLYTLVSALVFLIYRIQKYRANMQYQTQKKISELQILSLKNQIDPHFTFNILTSIGSLYSKGGEQKEAYNVFVKYSKLIRHTVQNSDKISVSLEDELNFVRNYIELEQFRNDHSFTYDISFEENVDSSRKIPRMLIHSFVENSIKHGIRQLDTGGQLHINISHPAGSHLIIVRDNGPGLSAVPSVKGHSTGRGLHIVDELISLFNQLEGAKLTYSLKDLSSDNTNHRGTEAIIVVPD